jgi:1-acyl-sn-glycerol-3-phosphate acyltransferase
MLRVFNLELRASGAIPTRGLLVCNHLSYLDILALGALAPGAFVAKREVKAWPVLGWFARLAGTLFVHREKRHDVGRAAAEIEAALDQGGLVVLFPEGTSSGGETVLPFKSALLAPAARREHPLTAAFIRYALADGSVPDEVCYWRDMTLVPHLLNLLGKQGVSARVFFAGLPQPRRDRKELARQLHAEVLRLKKSAVA